MENFPDGERWGAVNRALYQHRGWCCSEFATALWSHRIVNFSEPEVQTVLKSRKWPATAEDYIDMMKYTRGEDEELNRREGLTYSKELGVDFTSKGDRQVVLQNFFKVTFDPQ